MDRFRKDGISVLTVVDRRRKKNNGLYPVKIEVIYRRVQKYYPSGQDVSDQEWEGFFHARRRPRKCASIENSFYLIRNAVDQLAQKGEFSFRRLEARLGRSDDTVNEAIKEKMNSLLKQGKVNSFYRYRSTLHGIEKFAGGKINFNSVTASWLKKCEKSWKEEGKNCTTIETDPNNHKMLISPKSWEKTDPLSANIFFIQTCQILNLLQRHSRSQ